MERLRREFDEFPTLYRNAGNPGQIIIERVLDDISGKSAFVREATERYMEEMKTELGFDTSTFLEKMLINEIIVRWIRLQALENAHRNRTNETHDMDVGIYFDKRLHYAQQRYLRAVETLAKVRRLIADTQAKGAKMFKDLQRGK